MLALSMSAFRHKRTTRTMPPEVASLRLAASGRPRSESFRTVEDPELRRHCSQRMLHQPVMLPGQPPERPPPHPFPLGAAPIENTELPIQPLAQSIRLPRGTVAGILSCAGIGEPMTVPAGEDTAAIEDRHAPPAAGSWANEPRARAAQVAGSPDDPHTVFLITPFSAGRLAAIAQDHEISLRSCADRAHDARAPSPRPDRSAARPEHPFPRPAPHVETATIVRRGFRAVAPSISAARSAHRLSRNHLANCTDTQRGKRERRRTKPSAHATSKRPL